VRLDCDLSSPLWRAAIADWSKAFDDDRGANRTKAIYWSCSDRLPHASLADGNRR
jgi:hypothetical protein